MWNAVIKKFIPKIRYLWISYISIPQPGIITLPSKCETQSLWINPKTFYIPIEQLKSRHPQKLASTKLNEFIVYYTVINFCTWNIHETRITIIKQKLLISKLFVMDCKVILLVSIKWNEKPFIGIHFIYSQVCILKCCLFLILMQQRTLSLDSVNNAQWLCSICNVRNKTIDKVFSL